MNQKIPKRIIQIWGGSLELPMFSKASAANIKLLNPDFEYIFFNDESMEAFINEKCPEHRNTFESFLFPIQRYDFFRYLAIYHLGGFYFDMDVFLAKDLNELLNFECVFPFEMLTINRFLQEKYGMDWEVANYAFGAIPKHPFINAVIENCVRAQADEAWKQEMLRPIPKIFQQEFDVVCTTGPGLVSRTLAEFSDAHKVKVLFPDDVCDTSSWRLFGHYGIHLMKGTWRKPKGTWFRRLLDAWWTWEEKKVFKEARQRGPSRSLDFKRK